MRPSVAVHLLGVVLLLAPTSALLSPTKKSIAGRGCGRRIQPRQDGSQYRSRRGRAMLASSTTDTADTNAETDRSYAPVRAFCADTDDDDDNCEVMVRLDEVMEEQKQRRKGLGRTPDWSTAAYRVGIVVASYLAYPILAEILSLLPEGDLLGFGNYGSAFFSLVSIVFGTLTAATISDASSRLALLRSLAVDEVTVLLPLVKRLQAELTLAAERGDADRQDFVSDCLRLLFGHTTLLVSGSREQELQGIANGQDCLLRLVGHLQPALGCPGPFPASLSASSPSSPPSLDGVGGVGGAGGFGGVGGGSGGGDYAFAMVATERMLETRGRRLSLENAGIPDLQLGALGTISASLLAVFVYLSLDRGTFDLRDLLLSASEVAEVEAAEIVGAPPPPWPLGVLTSSEALAAFRDAFSLTVSFGQRTLFAYLAGALALLNNLTSDLNRPFEGELTMESSTLVATLVQERRTMAKCLDISIDEGLSMLQ